MQFTNIGWTDLSSSPLKYRDSAGKIVWACEKASPGCAHCYAESLALRWNKGKEFKALNMEGITPFVDAEELEQIITSKKITGKRVFIEDMSDLFGAWIPDVMIDQVFAAMALRPDVTFQVLTKRADRMTEHLSGLYRRGSIADAAVLKLDRYIWTKLTETETTGPTWPLPNVLVGFSAESQPWFNKRWGHVEKLAAAGWQTWVSMEPLLGDIGVFQAMPIPDLDEERGTLSWGVVGGESGRGHRPCEVAWIANIAEQFEMAGVPLFVKQDSGQYPGKQGRIPLDVWDMKQHPERSAA